MQQQFYEAALNELAARGTDVDGAETRGVRLPVLHPDLAAQILLLIQNRGHYWVEEGQVAANWSHSVQASAASLVGKLLPLARPQLLMFESDREPTQYTADSPAVFVRLTALLQERIASLVRVVRDQKLDHVVMPLMAADHAWSARYLYAPAAHVFLDSTLCVSATEVWVESARRAWRGEDPPERVATGRLKLRDIMPIDYIPVREIELPSGVSRATVKPYRERLQGLLDVDFRRELTRDWAVFPLRSDPCLNPPLLVDRRGFWSDRHGVTERYPTLASA